MKNKETKKKSFGLISLVKEITTGNLMSQKKKPTKPQKPVVAVASAKPAKPAKVVASAPAKKIETKPSAKAAKPMVAASKATVAKGAVAPKAVLATTKAAVTKPGKAAITATPVVAKGPAPKAAAPAAKGKRGKRDSLASARASLSASGALPKGSIEMSSELAAGGSVCREVACELMATTGGYCRLHYIKNWKKVQRKEVILKERKLNHYIEELVAKYPDKYIEALRLDLANEKDFSKVIADLEIDENLDDFELENEGDEGIIDNIKRGFEEDDDTF